MAIRFEADGEYYASSAPASGAFTVCGWFYRADTGGNFPAPFTYYLNDANHVYPFLTKADNMLRLYRNDSETSSAFYTVSTGTWFYLVLASNGSNYTGYAMTAGAASLSSATTSYAAISTPTLRIGNSHWGGDYWSGRVAAVKVYSAALSSAELLAEAAQFMPMRTANLFAFYPMVGRTVANDAVDLSGNGRDLTVTGSPAVEDGPPIPWRRGNSRVWLPPAAAAPSFNPAWARTSNQLIGGRIA